MNNNHQTRPTTAKWYHRIIICGRINWFDRRDNYICSQSFVVQPILLHTLFSLGIPVLLWSFSIEFSADSSWQDINFSHWNVVFIQRTSNIVRHRFYLSIYLYSLWQNFGYYFDLFSPLLTPSLFSLSSWLLSHSLFANPWRYDNLDEAIFRSFSRDGRRYWPGSHGFKIVRAVWLHRIARQHSRAPNPVPIFQLSNAGAIFFSDFAFVSELT